MSACGEGSDPITGENSVVNGTSIPVIGSSGTDITAINQANFPLEGALPLPGSMPDLGAALPESEGALGAEVSDVDASNPTGAPSTNAAAQTDFFSPLTALRDTDNNGQLLMSLTVAITSVVLNEYTSAIQAEGPFSDDTLNISKRLADKTSCSAGSVESTFNMNGTTITEGTVTFSDCASFGYTLNGDVVMASDTDNISENVRVALRSVSASYNDSSSVFDGELSVVFNGDTFQVSSDLLELSVNGAREGFTALDVTGVLAANGARTLTGSTTFEDQGSNAFVEYAFTDVSVFNSATTPNSGTHSLAHSDGSRIDFDFETGDPATFMYTVTQSDGFSTTFLEEWANVGFRVPLP